MNITHLNDDELDRAVLGEALEATATEHLASCLLCRRRRDGFLAVVEAAQGSDPDQATRTRLREQVLSRWGGSSPRRWVRWVGAAAAALLIGLLPLVHSLTSARPRINADVVLVEVDQVLNRDPLAAFASEDVVNTVVPVVSEGEERSVS
jgi:predicted anti-sigma-YlaC factor YlaD